MAGRRLAKGLSPDAQVWLLVSGLVLLWGLAFLAPGPTIYHPMVVPPWWAFVILFVIAELWTVRIRFRKQEQALVITELPLVVGLFTLQPYALVLTHVVGTAVAWFFYRRTTVLKAALNVSLGGASAAIGAVVFHLVVQGHSPLDPQAWVAVFVAFAAMALVEETVLNSVFAVYDGWVPFRTAARQAVVNMVLFLVVGLVGLVAAFALSYGNQAVPPLLFGVAAVFVSYRSYAALMKRHTSLEMLYALSSDLHAAGSIDEVASAVLGRARDMLRAPSGEFLLLREGVGLSRWTLNSEGPAQVTRWADADVHATLRALPTANGALRPWAAVARQESAAADGAASDAPALPPGQAAEPSLSRLLNEDPTANGYFAPWSTHLNEAEEQDSFAVSLTVADGMHGMLIISGCPDEWRDQRSNQRLIQMVANQATVALRHVNAVQRITYEAQHDQLTGIPNRATFQREAQATLRQVVFGRRPAIGVLDLDGFKTLNDSIGHHAGDMVISEVGRRLGALANERILAARLGGDEFAVLVRDSADDDDVLAVGRQVLDCLRDEIMVDGKPVHIGGSLGMAVAPRDGVTADAVMRCADFAMYAAKRGSAGLALFGREIGHAAGDPVALAADLRLALARGELSVAVQPLVNLTNHELHSVEVLARWRHAGLGVVEPETFIAAAERGGLTAELTRAILDAALRACRSWLDTGLEVRVAVNLSARAIDDAQLPDRVEAALADHGVPGRLLSLELTEGGLLDNPERVLPMLHRLRELGVRLAIDDFGTGYSSMTYVSSLAPDQVKIDKTFVQRLCRQGRDAAIVRSIVDLGNNLGVEVVAEGVSDLGTARAVEDLGCALAQGFLYAEPMPWQALPAWVRRWNDEGAVGASAGEGQVDPPEDGGSERLRLVR